MKYITVLDYKHNKVYQHENLEHFIDGWNGCDYDDAKNIEWYLTEVLEHNLRHCYWITHKDPGVITN